MENTDLDAGIIASDEQELAAEGISSEQPDTTDVETDTTEEEDDVETEEVIDQEAARKKKNAEKAKKLLAEKNELKTKLSAAERERDLAKLENKYGDIDLEAVATVESQYPTLALEDAYLLSISKQPTPSQPKQSFNSMVGTGTSNPETGKITQAELLKLDQSDYNLAMDRVKIGKLTIVG